MAPCGGRGTGGALFSSLPCSAVMSAHELESGCLAGELVEARGREPRMGVLVTGWRVGGGEIWSDVVDIFLSKMAGAGVIVSESFSFASSRSTTTQSFGGGETDVL